jgi:predicted type IV restriction endonuclease
MAAIPQRVANRLSHGIKRFQPVLSSAQSRDVNESDTVIIVTDMLSEVFGFDKYSEVTSENSIRGTFCDLATKIEGKLQWLVEVKAVGQELKDTYAKQAIDYGANQGVDWVVLTNGVLWRIYKIIFGKPIDQELLCEVNFLTLDCKDEDCLSLLYLLTREACTKSALGDYYDQKQALSKFSLAAAILSEPILATIRRELRRLSPDVRIEIEQIQNVLENEVLKREVVEGEKANEARKRVTRAVNRRLKAKEETEEDVTPPQRAATGGPLAVEQPPMKTISVLSTPASQAQPPATP